MRRSQAASFNEGTRAAKGGRSSAAGQPSKKEGGEREGAEKLQTTAISGRDGDKKKHPRTLRK